jgi:tetratricopeptide (TPR) repeat protein
LNGMLNNLRYSIKWAIIFFLPAILHSSNVSAQCPESKILLARLFEKSTLSTKDQIAAFLPTLDSVNKCTSLNDSIRAFLLRKVGWLYYYEGDNVNALKYYNEFLVIASNRGKPKIQIKHLVAGYWWLSMMFQALNRGNEARVAFDSCIDVAERYGYVDAANLGAIYKKMEHCYDVGDYYNCINYGRQCEILAEKFAKVTSGREHVVAIEYLSGALLWGIKALLELKKYDDAEGILRMKADEFRRLGYKRYYGTIYTQLAELEEYRGNLIKHLFIIKNQLNATRNRALTLIVNKL